MVDQETLLADGTLRVKDSKLYQLAKQNQLLSLIIPNLQVQIATAAEFDNNFPRTEEDEETRIVINYRNVRGRSSLFMIADDERLDRKFDIDHFMNGYLLQIGLDMSSDDIVDNVNTTLLSALTMALTAALSMDPELQRQEIKQLSENVIKVLVALIFDDPLDVFIAFNEQEPKEGQTESTSIVVAMWAVKSREGEELIDTNVDLLEELDKDLPEDLQAKDTPSTLELTDQYLEQNQIKDKEQ